jgi:hypothetical protein
MPCVGFAKLALSAFAEAWARVSVQAHLPVLALSVAAQAFGFRAASGLNLLAAAEPADASAGLPVAWWILGAKKADTMKRIRTQRF